MIGIEHFWNLNEMRTLMQHLFQGMNFRGDAAAKPYKDLLQGVGTEEVRHVELIGTTISQLLDGSRGTRARRQARWTSPVPREPRR